MELIDTGYGWLDPETGIEYATDREAAEAKAEAKDEAEAKAEAD
jgi:hypothetical protein